MGSIDEADILRAFETCDTELLSRLLAGGSIGDHVDKLAEPAPSSAPAATPALAPVSEIAKAPEPKPHLNTAAKPFVPRSAPAPAPSAPAPALAQLQDMFPNSPPDALAAALERAGGDLASSVEALLAAEGAFEEEFEDVDAAFSAWQHEHVYVDEEGQAVDPSLVRLDEDGQAYVLEYVPFEAGPAPGGPRFSEDEFPQLGGPGPAREAHGPAPHAPHEEAAPSALVAKLRLQKLRAAVPWVSPEAVARTFDEHRCSFVAARSALLAQFPKPPDWDKRHAAQQAAAPRAGPSSPVPPSAPASRASGLPRKWVTTGDAVATMYGDLREEARRCALMRNQCFMNATRAFLAGNKALAKELGHQGRTWNTRMKELHERAAADIFAIRNAGPGSALDLHGLHVKEALAVLADAVEERRGRGGGSFQVITGSGHHSSSVQRLRPAVERFLQAAPGVRYVQLPDKNRHVGMLEVHVSG